MIASIEWWSARPFTVRRAIDPRGASFSMRANALSHRETKHDVPFDRFEWLCRMVMVAGGVRQDVLAFRRPGAEES
jgi:hypothetical protein